MTILDILQNVWLLLRDGWRPALEITILAVGIYYALIFVRGTRGWPIVVGFLMVLLVLTVVTTALDLRVLLWLLTKFLTGLAIAVLVIFQPELRRMLAELGNLPLFTSATETRENIEVIIQTAERLSEVKIGALIAIEQSIQLAEVVESGVAVDCQGRLHLSADAAAGPQSVPGHPAPGRDWFERGNRRGRGRGVRGDRLHFVRLQGPTRSRVEPGAFARVSDHGLRQGPQVAKPDRMAADTPRLWVVPPAGRFGKTRGAGGKGRNPTPDRIIYGIARLRA